MLYVIIEYEAPTLDGKHMPLYYYSRPLDVIEVTNSAVCVTYNNEYYWFDKKYIKTHSH